MRIFSFCSGAI